MGSRLYRPPRDNRVAVGQDVLRQHAHNIATEQLIPRIAVQNHIAVETIETPIYFYSRIPRGAGRRCSCFDIEVSPHNACRCCFGTGTVGGYNKHGTHLEIIDVTHPSVRAVNVMPDYNRRSRPRQFVLVPGAVQGYLISRMFLQTNIGEIDHIFALTDIAAGTDINAFVRAPTDLDFVEFTETALQQRLFNPWIDVKITLQRASVATESPRFGLLFIRYNRLVDRVIKANIQRSRKSNLLGEFGTADDWVEQQFWTDNTLRAVTSEDWVAHISNNTRWKIISVEEFAPEDLLVSWDITTRLIQPYGALSFFPL